MVHDRSADCFGIGPLDPAGIQTSVAAIKIGCSMVKTRSPPGISAKYVAPPISHSEIADIIEDQRTIGQIEGCFPQFECVEIGNAIIDGGIVSSGPCPVDHVPREIGPPDRDRTVLAEPAGCHEPSHRYRNVLIPDGVQTDLDRIERLWFRADGWHFSDDSVADAFFAPGCPDICGQASRALFLCRWMEVGHAADPVHEPAGGHAFSSEWISHSR